MSEWYNIKEQSAGKYRLLLLWQIYKICGLTCLKLLLIPIAWFIWLFAKPVRRASKEYQQVLFEYCACHNVGIRRFGSFAHILSYAHSLADKMSAVCDPSSPLKFKINNNESWQRFKELIDNNSGVLLLSSHLGNIEALCAYPDKNELKFKKLHALMEVGQNSIFHKFIQERTQNHSFILHPTEEMDFHAIMTLYESLCEGDMLLMAGDRVSAENPHNTITGTLLDRPCRLPHGAFRFAQKMEHPTFAAVLLYVGNNTYEINLQQLDITRSTQEIADRYCRFIEQNILRCPTQWYNFYDYFNTEAPQK